MRKKVKTQAGLPKKSGVTMWEKNNGEKEYKKTRALKITDTGWELLREKESRTGYSISELIERFARDIKVGDD